MGNRHVYILAGSLALAGIAVFLYKWLVVGLPLLEAERAAAWEVEAQYRFEATGGPAKLTTFAPRNTARTQILDQRFLGSGYGLSATGEDGNRRVTLSIRKAKGAQLLHMRFVAHRFLSKDRAEPAPEERPKRPDLTGAKKTAAQAIADEAKAKSADDAGLVAAVLSALRSPDRSDNARELLGRTPKAARKARAAVAVLSLAGINAVQINGIALAERSTNLALVRWIEADVGGKWTAYQLDGDGPGVPSNYLAWWRGPTPFAVVTGGGKPEVRLTVARLDERVLDRILSEGSAAEDRLITFSLFGLPLSVQQVYRVMMVVPVGIFVLLLLRNVIGFKSLGTFMPVLIAIAFRETQLVWGLILFTAILATGLMFRSYLEYLKLLLVPRLASVLIFVILLMAVLSVITTKLGFERGISVALFPMVILTMTIERVSVIWDERGPAEALRQALGSLAIATLCYLIMTLGPVEHLFFTFPELLLVLLAGCLVLGRYSGFRLLELKRFRVLAGEAS